MWRAYKFRNCNANQLLLLAPDLKSLVPQQSLVRVVSDMIDVLDLRPLLRRFCDSGLGVPPAMRLKSCFTLNVGAPPSAQICPGPHRQVAFRWLAANNRPGFRIFAAFLRKHPGDITPYFSRCYSYASRPGKDNQGSTKARLRHP